MTTPPLFLLDALPAGDQAVLDGPEGRHAATVKRLRPGEVVLLGDGRGTLAHAVVDATGRDVVELTITDRSRKSPDRKMTTSRRPSTGLAAGATATPPAAVRALATTTLRASNVSAGPPSSRTVSRQVGGSATGPAAPRR